MMPLKKDVWGKGGGGVLRQKITAVFKSDSSVTKMYKQGRLYKPF